MQTINSNYKSLSLLMSLNADRLFYLIAIPAALALGAWIGGF